MTGALPLSLDPVLGQQSREAGGGPQRTGQGWPPPQWWRCSPAATHTGLKRLPSSAQVPVPVPSETSTLPRETAGGQERPHRLPDEQQPWSQQEADPVQVGDHAFADVGPALGGGASTSPAQSCREPGEQLLWLILSRPGSVSTALELSQAEGNLLC